MGIKVWATLLNALDQNNEVPKFGTSQLPVRILLEAKHRYPSKRQDSVKV